MVTVDGRRVGIEVKHTDHPSLTPSMRIALGDLDLDRIVVVHAGTARFPLADRITAAPARDVLLGSLADGGG